MSSAEVPPMHRLGQARTVQDARRREARQLATKNGARQARDELIATSYQEQFENGDREKLLRCVELCEATDVPIPSWARCALAAAVGSWRSAQAAGKYYSLDRCIFGKRTGRHANIATAERERHRRQVIFAAVEAARYRNIKGDQVFVAASRLLEAYGKRYGEAVYSEPKTVKSTYYDLRTKGAQKNKSISSELALLTLNLPELFLPHSNKSR